jgi:YD repeat-containing protein
MYTEDALGNRTWLAYDGLGRQIKTVANAVGAATDNGVKDPRSPYYNPVVNLPDRDVMALTTYDANGRVMWTQDALERKSWSAYDSLGRLVRTIANATGNETGGGPLDPRSPAYVRRSNTDQDVVTQTVYDSQGRVSATVDPQGNRTHHEYDALGRRIKTIANFVDGVYNANFPDEDRIQTTVYDLAGRVVETLDAAGIRTRYEYDRLGRRIKTIVNYADGVFSSAAPDEDLISVTTYNKAGQVVAATDARGTQTAFTYDKAGRRLTITQAADSPLASVAYLLRQGRMRAAPLSRASDHTASAGCQGVRATGCSCAQRPIQRPQLNRGIFLRPGKPPHHRDRSGGQRRRHRLLQGRAGAVHHRPGGHGDAVPLRRAAPPHPRGGGLCEQRRRPHQMGVEQRLEAQRRDGDQSWDEQRPERHRGRHL